MGSLLSPKAPRVPSASENLEGSITALLENQDALREMERSNQLWELDQLNEIAPQVAELAMAFENAYGSQMRDAELAATRQTRAGDLATMEALGPQWETALQASDPTSYGMRQELASQIMGDLSMGGDLTGSQLRDVEQSVRRGQTARGITRGAAPVTSEAVERINRSQAMKAQRQAAADAFLRTSAATRPDYLNFASNRGGVQQANPQLAPQNSPDYFSKIWADQTAANNLQSQLNYNASAAGAGNTAGLLGTIGGAALGSMFGPVGMFAGGMAGGR